MQVWKLWPWKILKYLPQWLRWNWKSQRNLIESKPNNQSLFPLFGRKNQGHPKKTGNPATKQLIQSYQPRPSLLPRFLSNGRKSPGNHSPAFPGHHRKRKFTSRQKNSLPWNHLQQTLETIMKTDKTGVLNQRLKRAATKHLLRRFPQRIAAGAAMQRALQA